MSSTYYSDDLPPLRSRRFWKRLGLLIGVPVVAALVLFLILWNTFFRYVPPGKMLVIVSKHGTPLPPGQILADEGQQGIQRRVLGEGWHFVMPISYTTELKDNKVVEPDFVGIVTSSDGTKPPEGRVVAAEGEQGIREKVLLPGSYRLNPYAYTVETVKMVQIKPGYVGIKRRLLGKDGTSQFAQSPDEKGIVRDEILEPGFYPINTKQYEVKPCEVGIYQKTYNYDPASKGGTSIQFKASDGFTIHLDCTIEWEVKPEFWPDWLVKFETLENIEKIVIDQHVRKICPDRGSNFGAQDFLDGTKREKFQEDFRLELDKACKEDNVIIRSAFIRNIIIPESFLQQKRKERIAFETKLTSEALAITATSNAEVAEAFQMIKQREAEAEAETARLVANIERQTQNVKQTNAAQITLLKAEYSNRIATLDAEKRTVVGEAEAEASRMRESATAGIFKMKVDLFGRDTDAYLRYTMSQEMNPKMRMRLFQSGPGTLWTNMGEKGVNLFMPIDREKKMGPEKPKGDE
jgi:regulator of protease activity HflC (stomatin/prohibitin superfamily)